MASRCLCARILAVLRDDPRLMTLPLAARMMFLLLAEAAARSPVPGLVPFAEPRRVALLVSCSETEAETQLETLETEGLIRREDGGLAIPLIRDAAPRAEAARRNGAAGGRPRKGETREAYLARRQGEMIMPLAGGKPSETQSGNPDISPVVVVESKKGDISTPTTGGRAREETPAWVSLGQEVAEIAGLDGARGGFDYRPVQAWLNAGIAPEVIRAAVRSAVGWSGYAARRVCSLAYFDNPVRREAERGGSAPAPAPRDIAAELAIEARAKARIEAVLASVGRAA